MKNKLTQGVELKAAVLTAIFALSTNANAALVQGDVDAIVTDVLADAGIALAAGFAIFAFVKAAKVGFSLLSSFLSKGARG